MNLIPIILCGGAGSRLWPISREMHPKPFIRLPDGQSLLQKAFLRGANLAKNINKVDNVNIVEIIIVTNSEFFHLTENDIKAVNKKNIATSYVLEPSARNTAPAIAAATLFGAQKHGKNVHFLVLAADHLIKKQDNFAGAVRRACKLASEDSIVTFGIKPTTPDTGFGYIEVSEKNPSMVKSFVEKPNLETAKKYLAQGDFLWNSGMFCFTSGTMITQMQKHCPDIFTDINVCLQGSVIKDINQFSQKIELTSEKFKSVREQSIDYAVIEKADSVGVVSCDLDWSDVGSWNALGELIAPDNNGNRIVGEVENYNSTNCTIYGTECVNGRVIGAVGVDNLIVVDTPDALLIADKDKVQDVKQVYNELKSKNHQTYKFHRTVERPWGTYTVLENVADAKNGFKIKRIEVKAGASLSLQMHHHRSEHWIVVGGVARVTNGDKTFTVNINESTYIPAGNKHRLHNPTNEKLIMIEVQTGDYLEEDDIVRFDDVYGRK